ncbi:MAG: LacI family DNA-binding transcriptional regulator [Pseudomonadota bacterium]
MSVKKAISSSDVARLAGVSRSAVSRTFTPGAYVSDETRAKVMAAAEALSYRPNAIARSLSTSQSGLIGIVTSSLDNPFYARLLSTLATLLQAQGYGILLVVADDANFDTLIESLLAYQVNGAILTTAPLRSTSAFELQRYGKPVVLVDRYLNQEMISSVSGDNHAGSAAVADLLVRGGHQRVAFLGGDEGTSSSRDRRHGFTDRLARHGIVLYAEESGFYSYELGMVAARKLLALSPKPDAIFCANDAMAVAAVEVARAEFGLRIPEDIAIVGYDNAGPVGWPTYQLTTVDQNLEEMAQAAIDLLVRKLESGDVSTEHLSVAPTLVERSTTREQPAAAGKAA